MIVIIMFIFILIIPHINIVMKYKFKSYDSYNLYLLLIIHVTTMAITMVKNGMNKNSIQIILIVIFGLLYTFLLEKICEWGISKIVKKFLEEYLMDGEEIYKIFVFCDEVYFNTESNYYYLDLNDGSTKRENDIRNLPNVNKIKDKFD